MIMPTPNDTAELDQLRSGLASFGLSVPEVVLPEHKFVISSGVKIHYLDWGSNGKPPMLLVHGGGLTARSWDFFSLAMRQQCHVFAIDQRGHGDSQWPEAPDYRRDDFIGDLRTLADEIGEPFILVGLSLGGVNSLSFTAAYPSYVRALVIVDVGPELSSAGVDRLFAFMNAEDKLGGIEALLERSKNFNPLRPEDQLNQSIRRNLKQLPDGSWTWKYDPRIRTRELWEHWTNSEDMWSFVHQVHCPTLVVRGGDSDIFTKEAAEHLQAAIPGSQLAIVERAGHTVPQDNPAAFEAAVKRFLSSL